MYKLLFSICLIPVAAWSQTQDPTRPLNGASTAGGHHSVHEHQGLQLSSILYSESRRVAVINGQALNENQKSKDAGFTLIKIAPDFVNVFQNGKITTLRLSIQDVKKFESVENGLALKGSSKK